MAIEQHQLSKIRWQCRRGMLELDVLLQDFFDRHYLQLPVSLQKKFVELLKNNDQDLFFWLFKNGRPENSSVADMVNCIQQSYANEKRV